MAKSDRLRVVAATEPVVVGVIDGRAPRPAVLRRRGPIVELARDETLAVVSADGQRLLELSMGEAGPEIRLLGSEVGLSLPGKLRLSADSIELHARKGDVAVSAADDVIVAGTTIRLN